MSYNSKGGNMKNMNKAMMIKKQTNTLPLALVLAVVATVITFLLVGLLSPAKSYVYELFFERSWIQHVTTLCFWTIIAILFFKQMKFNYEKKALASAEQIIKVPEFSSTLIWSDADRVRQKFEDEKHKGFKNSLIFVRIINSLDRLRKTQSTSAFEEYFRTRSDIDSEELESSYADLRYFTWLIPTLGFLGTVMGIGIGIKGFSVIIANAQGFSQIQKYLPTVTGYLGTAFDTTLLALGLSAIAVFYMSFSLKREEQLLENIDNFCLDGICPIFQEHSGTSDEIIKALDKNVEEIRKSMNGNRAAVDQVIREELPVRLGDELIPQFKAIAAQLEKIASIEGQIALQQVQNQKQPELDLINIPLEVETRQTSGRSLMAELKELFQEVANTLERNNILFESLDSSLKNIRYITKDIN
jgi:biopolymer transport protein ExbB/TolQ